MLTKNGQKSPKELCEYICTTCSFNTGNKSKYNRHCLTARHKKLTSSYENGPIIFPCKNCKKTYKSRMGLWQHSKKCSLESDQHSLIENP